MAPTKARICHKLGQISSDKSTANPVFGLYDRLQDHDASSSGGENHGNPGQMAGSVDDGDGLSQTIIRIYRDTHRIGYGRAHSAITLPTIANVEVKGTFNRRSELQHQNPTDPRGQMEMRGWIYYLGQSNGKAIITPAPNLIITRDSSMKGWGAICNGVTTQGLWNT